MLKNNQKNNKTRDTSLTATIISSVNEQNSLASKTKELTSETRSIISNNMPLLGQPGGLDDPQRKGLSGAGIKWYLRYLSQGMEPQVARQKAEDHRTASTNQTAHHEQRKRSSDANLSPEDQLKKNKTSILGQVLPTNNKTIRVAVLAKDYPRIALNSEELTILEEALVDEMTKGWTSKLVFNAIQYKPGMLLIDCSDDNTANWLQEVVSKLESWKGEELQSLLGEKIPKIFNISVQLPKSVGQTQTKALRLLHVQNVNIYTDLWEILSCCDEGNTQRMTIAIDYASFETICFNDNQLNYRFGKISVQLDLEKNNIEMNKTNLQDDA